MINKSVIPIDEGKGKFFYMIGGGGKGSVWTFESPTKILKAFNECPPLAAVILKKSQYSSNGKPWVLNAGDDNEAKGDYAQQLRRILKQPNFLQNWKQFKVQTDICKNLFGFVVVLVVNPAGFTKLNEYTQMFILPPWLTDIKLSGKYINTTSYADVIEKITFRYGGTATPVPLDNIILLKDFNINKMETAILPESRVHSLGGPIETINVGLRSINVLTKRRGGIGILSNTSKDAIGSMAMDPQEKIDVQDKLKTNYGLSEEQSEIIITNASLNWQSMAFNVGELKIQESIKTAVDMIADTMGFHSLLLSGTTQGTYNNLSSLQVDIYQNSIIPESENDFEEYSRFFKAEQNKIRVVIDFEHVDVLQKNKKDEATARNTLSQACEREFYNNAITLNQWLEELEYATVPHGDKFYSELKKEGWDFGKASSPAAATDQQQQQLN